MRGFKIMSYLKQALLADVFHQGEGDILENKEVFYKSQFSGKFEGPYLLSTNNDYLELWNQCKMGMIYVLDYSDKKETAIAFKLRLKEAVLADVVAYKDEIKQGISFYLLVKNAMNGPYVLSELTNAQQFKTDLKNNIVFVLSKTQTFEFIETKIAV
jgi:hypothetical protein